MKKLLFRILLGLLLLVSGTGHAANWITLYESPAKSQYYDSSDITYNNGIITFWQKTTTEDAFKYNGIHTFYTNSEIDFRKLKIRNIKTTAVKTDGTNAHSYYPSEWSDFTKSAPLAYITAYVTLYYLDNATWVSTPNGLEYNSPFWDGQNLTLWIRKQTPQKRSSFFLYSFSPKSDTIRLLFYAEQPEHYIWINETGLAEYQKTDHPDEEFLKEMRYIINQKLNKLN